MMIDSILASNPFANIALNVVKSIANEVTETLVNEKEAMINEVESDIRVLEHYLIYGIFDASGFSAFCQLILGIIF